MSCARMRGRRKPKDKVDDEEPRLGTVLFLPGRAAFVHAALLLVINQAWRIVVHEFRPIGHDKDQARSTLEGMSQKHLYLYR